MKWAHSIFIQQLSVWDILHTTDSLIITWSMFVVLFQNRRFFILPIDSSVSVNKLPKKKQVEISGTTSSFEKKKC